MSDTDLDFPLRPRELDQLNSCMQQGMFSSAEKLLRHHLNNHEATTPAFVRLQTKLSQAVLLQNRAKEALEVTLLAARAAHALGRVDLLVEALDARAQAYCFDHKYANALRVLQVADNYLTDGRVVLPYTYARLSQTKGQSYKGCDLWADGEHYLREALGLFEDLKAWGDWAHAACELANLIVACAHAQGTDFQRLNEASTLLERAQPHSSEVRFSFLIQLGRLSIGCRSRIAPDSIIKQPSSTRYAHELELA